MDNGPKFRNVSAICKIEWTTYRKKQRRKDPHAQDSFHELSSIVEKSFFVREMSDFFQYRG